MQDEHAEPLIVDGAWQVPARFNFTRDVIERLAQDPDRHGLTFVGADRSIQRRTFAELAAHAARWAGLLGELGVARGDRVLVVVGKTLDWHPIMLGALKLGAVAIPGPDMLRAKDLAFRVRHAGVKLVIADRAVEAEVAPLAELLDDAPPVCFTDEVAERLAALPDTAPTADTAADELAFVLYTSGTTKEPKGVMHTHGYCFAQRGQAQSWLASEPGDLVWCTAGTGWAKSIWNVLLGPWSTGAEIVLHGGGFVPSERFELIRELGITVLCQAPTEYRLMAKEPGLAGYDLSRVRHAVSAGEPLNPEVIRIFQETFGVTIRDGYGQTENTLLVGNLPGTEVRPGSMGLPTIGHRMAIVDDAGTEVPDGEEGNVALHGRPPALFAGYWEQPDATAECFRGEWYLTGDRAVRDEDGYFWFAGRADDVILSAAYRIGPFEVESALLEHDAVAESAVIGKPDPDRGQLVKAFVVLRPGASGDDALVKELQDHVKRVTAPYKYPREIEFVSELPKTRSGKIRRVELRKQEEAKAGG